MIALPLDKARAVAERNNETDPDGWTYKVRDCGNGLGVVLIYDEFRQFVGEM